MRVWGTVGYLLLVAGFPPLLHASQRALGRPPEVGVSEPGLASIYPIAALFCLAAAGLALGASRGGSAPERAARGELRRLLRHRPYRRALVYAFLAWGLLQAPILLFPVYVRDRGGDLDTLSRMWLPMLALEIPLVLYSGAALHRIGSRGLVTIGALADGLRWTICALTSDLRVVFAAQLLHGLSIAGLAVGIQLYVESVVPERLRASGQGVLAMLGPSVGGIVSSAGAGLLLEHFGSRAPCLVGGLGALTLGAATYLLLPEPRREAEPAA